MLVKLLFKTCLSANQAKKFKNFINPGMGRAEKDRKVLFCWPQKSSLNISMLGITFKSTPKMGDGLQFASFPENYFLNTNQKVIDIDHQWFFDHNPYVVRDVEPTEVIDLFEKKWPQLVHGTPMKQYISNPVFFSTADRTSTIFNHKTYLRHPRLYQFEDLPRQDRQIVLHTQGSDDHRGRPGEDHDRILSQEILDHIQKTYQGYDIIQIGSVNDLDAGVVDCRGTSLWETTKLIAQSAIFIGVDSGPSWIVKAYPRVFCKKVLTQYSPEYLSSQFVPMHVTNMDMQWHEQSCLYYNRTIYDAGITYSYLKL